MKITPLESRVLVRVEKEKDEMVKGLYRPETVEKNVGKGTVTAVGPGKMLATGDGLHLLECTLEEGDVILYRRGTGLDVDGLLLLEEYEVLAKVS
jgi:co-chaperonin GroES (HSP10)